jgi:hypothetical protein
MLRVEYDRVVRHFDSLLPERAQLAKAMVAIQVLREADLGILRFWFAQQPDLQSGYQHLEVNLRNADVVSSAVLPVVEAIFDRAEASSGGTRARNPASNTVPLIAREQPAQDDCRRNNAKRCTPALAGRLLHGPYFATTSYGAALALGVGVRWRMLPMFTVEGDVDYQTLTRSKKNGLPHQTTLALHALYEFRNRAGRGVAVGPGVGLFAASSRGQFVYVPRASLRTEMFVPLGSRVDLAVMATVAKAWQLPEGVPNRGFFASAMLGFDLQFN